MQAHGRKCLDNGTILVVAKIKVRPDVGDSLVCLRKKDSPTQSCTWSKNSDLQGDWITYAGTSQVQSCAPRIADILVLRSIDPNEVDPN
jgi:hypothetical protein